MFSVKNRGEAASQLTNDKEHKPQRRTYEQCVVGAVRG